MLLFSVALELVTTMLALAQRYWTVHSYILYTQIHLDPTRNEISTFKESLQENCQVLVVHDDCHANVKFAVFQFCLEWVYPVQSSALA